MARLVVDSGPDEGMVFPLNETVTTLGRSSSNLILVSDKRASRFHAEVLCRDAAFRVHDIGSKNGTSLNGVRLTEECTLHHGDQIRIGQTLFVFEDEEEQAAAAGERRRSKTSSVRLADETPARACRSVPAGHSRVLEAAVRREKPPEGMVTHHRLDVLLRLLAKMRSVLELDPLLNEILSLVFEVFQPQRGLILLYDPKRGTLEPRVVKTAEDLGQIAISRTIVHQAIRERMALLITDAASDLRFQGAESIVAQQIRSAICAPLIAQEKVLGVLYIDSRSQRVDYGQAELELLAGITDQAAMAISNALLHQTLVQQNRLERELEIARTIQTNLLPKHPPVVPGFEVAAMSVPAKSVGGDYYDFIPLDPDRLGVAVADVSGKGVPAAILTASVRSALQIEARQGDCPLPTVLSHLNEMACRDASNDMFIALFFGILQISSRRFRYINAGHCSPLLFDSDGNESRLDRGGCVLGVMPDRQFEQGEVRLLPGSTLIIYSDGVTDMLDEKQEAFGLDRLRQTVAANREATAEMLRAEIAGAMKAHQGNAEQFDDYTLVVIKAL
jgi:serine phosphatase RsbU (regulator of sigma subunit)